MHRVGKCSGTLSVSPDLPRLAGEVSLETFFCAVLRKQNYICHGSSVVFWLISDVCTSGFICCWSSCWKWIILSNVLERNTDEGLASFVHKYQWLSEILFGWINSVVVFCFCFVAFLSLWVMNSWLIVLNMRLPIVVPYPSLTILYSWSIKHSFSCSLLWATFVHRVK